MIKFLLFEVNCDLLSATFTQSTASIPNLEQNFSLKICVGVFFPLFSAEKILFKILITKENAY